jgi:intracellular septation protein
MQAFYDILPVFLFFIAFKLFDIYVATVIGIAATTLQVVATRLWKGKWDRKQLVTFAVFAIFGSMTLYFHNPIFVKWKPTIIFWIFSLALLFSQLFLKKTIIQRLMEGALQEKGHIPNVVWGRLNFFWTICFMILGSINLYIAYNYDNNAWVNFKFYGITAALFVISIFQALYLMRYITEVKLDK